MSGQQGSALGVVIAASHQQGGPVPVVPVVVPVVVPGVNFAQLQLDLDACDPPAQAIAQDTNALANLVRPAQQAITAADAANAPGLVAAAQALHARIALAVPVQQKGFAVEGELNTAMALVPAAVVAAWGKDHPVKAALDATLHLAMFHNAGTNFPAVDGQFDSHRLAIAAFAAEIGKVAAEFARLDRLWTRFGPELTADDPGLAPLAKRFFTGAAVRPVDWTALCNKAEKAVVPDNKQMQALRKQPGGPGGVNPGEAMLGRMVLAQMVKIVCAGETFYASSYDREVDHFGGSWPLAPAGGTGKIQWLAEWEFHIHGAATRNGNGDVDGFNILVGHIKPCAQERATGASVRITDGTLLGAVMAGSQDKFARWATSKEGAATLARQRRS